MTNEEFFKIVDDLKPFKEHIQYVTLHCNGEPLLDKKLHDKVKYLKVNGFRNWVCNKCKHAYRKRSKQLIEAQLDTIIVSIDGIKAETHEKIRKGLKYEKVLTNVLNFIRLRNEFSVKNQTSTRVLVRFIMQP